MERFQNEGCEREIANFLCFEIAIELFETGVLFECAVETLQHQDVTVEVLFIYLKRIFYVKPR